MFQHQNLKSQFMEQLKKYNLEINEVEIKESVSRIIKESGKYKDIETLKFLFSIIDLTSLNVSDTRSEITDMTEKVNWFAKTFPNLPNVAAICVYPALVPVVKKTLSISGVEIAAVGAGFPASQTFFDIKTLECKRAVIEGATEVDTVISVGEFFEKNYDYVFREIAAQKKLYRRSAFKGNFRIGTNAKHERNSYCITTCNGSRC